jgi:hypothetical protein
MMSPRRSFVLKLASFAIGIFALQNVVYDAFGPWGDFDELVAFERYRPVQSDVLALGDSTYIHMGEADADRRTLRALLQAQLPDEHVVAIVHPGYHGGVFKEFIAYARTANKLPSRVLIDINLASFGEGWDGDPQYEFLYERYSLQMHRHKWLTSWVPFLSTFRAIDLIEKTERPSLVQIVWPGPIAPAHAPFARTLPTTAFAAQFRGTYLRPLAHTHRRLVALRETAELLESAGVRPIFYVTPVDYESGMEAVGAEFRPGLERNVAVVRDELAQVGCPLHDFSELLPARAFIWHTDEHRPGEHLAEAGRKELARRLAEVLEAPDAPGPR